MIRRPGIEPSVQQMRRIYRELSGGLNVALRKAGSSTPYTARVFREPCVIAADAAEELVL
jgi:hypothetical protein